MSIVSVLPCQERHKLINVCAQYNSVAALPRGAVDALSLTESSPALQLSTKSTLLTKLKAQCPISEHTCRSTVGMRCFLRGHFCPWESSNLSKCHAVVLW